MGKVSAIRGQRKNRTPLKHMSRKDVAENKFENIEGPIETQHLLISSLLPENVKAFLKQCEQEVERLCGGRHEHSAERRHYRWGSAEGSIVLANQRVALELPRVRKKGGEEVRLETYEEFQNPELFDQAVFTEGIRRVSQRDYEKGASKLASSFGFKKSSVSKRWIKATAKKLEELQTRSLKVLDIRAVFIDGKRFRTHGVIVALGVASSGRKYVLGIYQASSENHESCLELLNDLERRGLPSSGLLFIVDGGSGLNKALDIKYACHDKRNRRAIRIRCYVHKWRMSEAKVLSDRLEAVLCDLNMSALQSYLEAKADLLVIHELKLSKELKRFFSTTNPIESLNSLIEEDMRRVKRWTDSGHFQRWLATYCLNSEKRMRRCHGYRALPGLWVTLRTLTDKQNDIDSTTEVA